MDMSFSIDDIKNKNEWYERAVNEAKQIHRKPSTARGRTLNQIIEVCLYGHAPEQYLLETGWDDDERPYKDLLDPMLAIFRMYSIDVKKQNLKCGEIILI